MGRGRSKVKKIVDRSKSTEYQEPAAIRSPLMQGEPETIRTYYQRGAMGGFYKDEALDASFDAQNGQLTLDYAQDKDWENTAPTNKQRKVEITVQNGMINGNPVNLDLNDNSIKTIDAVRLSSAAEHSLTRAGFGLNSRTNKWERGYKGYSKEGSTLYVDSALPDSFTGITRIKTKYGAVDTRIIKQAGFKWNGQDKLWEKK